MKVKSDRQLEISRIQSIILQRHYPRVQMMVILLLAAIAGFLASFFLHHFGLSSLGLRYLLSVFLAYAAFMLLVAGWLWLRRRESEIAIDFFAGKIHQDESNAEVSHRNADSNDIWTALSISGGEEFVILIGIMLSLASIWSISVIFWDAPSFFAELLVDMAIAAGIYQRLKTIESRHWLETAFRRTCLPFIVLAGCFYFAGLVLQFHAPHAASLGDALRQWYTHDCEC